MMSMRKKLVAGAVLLVGAAIVTSSVLLFGGKRNDGKNNGDPGAARPGFVDGAQAAGITFHMDFLSGEQGEKFKFNLYDHGCGVAIGDFDGDGHDDIYFVNQLGPNALYRNKGDGTFEDVTETYHVGLGDRICVAATWADYDNDGRLDLFVTSTRGGNVLFHNEGPGKPFKDVTQAAHVEYIGHSQTAVFFDYDNDGLLDLFVTNTAGWTRNKPRPDAKYYEGGSKVLELASAPKEKNILYHNEGNGRFRDVTKDLHLSGKGWGGDVAVFDYDEDGYLDLLVTNMFGRSQLYHNQKGTDFVDVTRQVLGRTSWGAIGARAFDFDNDGRLDLLITDMHSDMWTPASNDEHIAEIIKSEYAGRKFNRVIGPGSEFNSQVAEKAEASFRDAFGIVYEDVVFGNTLYHNLGGGKFEEVSDRAGMETFWPWGIATGDFDNDGFEDVFLPSGMGYPYFYWPNVLMMNNRNGTFSDRSNTRGIEPPPGGRYLPEKIGGKDAPRSSRCAAVADFRGEGRLDLVVNNFNGPAYFFRNNFPRQNYLAFRLKGTHSNRDAIGALVRVYVGKQVMVRQVQAAGGYLSQSSPTLHFGLGKHTSVDRVEILWPRGPREPQVIRSPQINKLYPITEPRS